MQIFGNARFYMYWAENKDGMDSCYGVLLRNDRKQLSWEDDQENKSSAQ